jgi:hypothetical protein
MDEKRRSNLVLGLFLLLAGIWFLAVQLFPGLSQIFHIELAWPLFVVGAGMLLLVLALLLGAPDMAVPACIVGGIGMLLYWQNATGRWESWSYAWALIPGFAGIGVILAGVLSGRMRRALGEGFGMILSSLVLFAIFASFLGGWRLFGPYWPVLIILLGLWLLVRPWLRLPS